MILLITAFGPFPGVPKNPSEALARQVAADRRWAGLGVTAVVRVFATDYAAVARLIPAVLGEERPDVVLMLGVASRRRHLSVERRAANRASILHPDVSGARPAGLSLHPGAPAFRPARAPLVAITVAAGRAGFRTKLSRSAGTYLCNASYFHMLGALPPDRPCLFLHIPNTKGRASRNRLAAAVLAAARLLARRVRPRVMTLDPWFRF